MARYDVSPHLSKWWKGVRPDDGQVSYFIFAEDIFIGKSVFLWSVANDERNVLSIYYVITRKRISEMGAA